MGYLLKQDRGGGVKYKVAVGEQYRKGCFHFSLHEKCNWPLNRFFVTRSLLLITSRNLVWPKTNKLDAFHLGWCQDNWTKNRSLGNDKTNLRTWKLAAFRNGNEGLWTASFCVLRVQRKRIWNSSSFVSLKTYLGGRGQYNGQIFSKRSQTRRALCHDHIKCVQMQQVELSVFFHSNIMEVWNKNVFFHRFVAWNCFDNTKQVKPLVWSLCQNTALISLQIFHLIP